MIFWFENWQRSLALIAGTFASEDLACITAGEWIRAGSLPAVLGIAACFVGIYVGDLGLWLVGRIGGRKLMNTRWFTRRISTDRLEAAGKWFDRNDWGAIFAARFLPGTRLPLYIAAGMLGRRGWRFVGWSFLAALLWTPLLVLGAAGIGQGLSQPVRNLVGNEWLVLPVCVAAVYAPLAVGRRALKKQTRHRIFAKTAKLWRWEFWPSWLFYVPVIPWLAWLSLRYRSLTAWTAANPGIPQGGVVGESKFAILSRLAGEGVVPTLLIPAGDTPGRIEQFFAQVDKQGWQFPLILKPDASQRGAGLKLARSEADVRSYLDQTPAEVIVQPYHPGPHEAGIFYYRLPGENRGRIFSITDKQFPVLVGDGTSTIEELIWNHPRFRMQGGTFLSRHAAQAGHVLEEGEQFRLAIAGNHCQGTMFLDGRHLFTPNLEQAIDEIAKRFPGFYIGRFDIRYSDVEEFRAGRDLAVVELNGVTSESTNIYDPAGSLWGAYRTLYRQWELIYRIGNANRVRGIQQTSVRELIRSLREFYSRLEINPLAD